MKEELISFETAKLAKEKGFNKGGYAYYVKNKFERSLTIKHMNESPALTYQAPTQTLLQKWLRETHHIHIAIHLVYTKPINYYAEVLKGGINGQEYHLRSYNTYEKALESGIKKGLKWILGK